VPRGLAVRATGRRLGAADLFDGFPAYYQSALVARDALEAAGPFDPSYRIHPDHDHAFRLFAPPPLNHLPHPPLPLPPHPPPPADPARAWHPPPPVRAPPRGPGAAAQPPPPRPPGAPRAPHSSRPGRPRLRLGEAAAARAAFDRAVALAPLRPAYRWRRWRA